MEPRARAGKNVGKETFNTKEIASLLYGHGDVSKPLPETIRVVDEILTEFVEGVCFEATRHAASAARVKLKFDDFEFAMRRNKSYLGKIRLMADKRVYLKKIRRVFDPEDNVAAVAKDIGNSKDGKDGAGVGGDDLDDAGGPSQSQSQSQGDSQGNPHKRRAKVHDHSRSFSSSGHIKIEPVSEELLGDDDDDYEVLETVRGQGKKRKKAPSAVA